MLKFIVLILLSFGLYAQKPLQYVNSLIGTAPSQTPSALKHSESASESKGHIIPMVGLPHGMTQWSPQTRATELKCIAPYYYKDTHWQGIRATHWLQGSCVQDYASFTIMPFAGKTIKTKAEERGIAYNHANEQVNPSYYRLDLPENKITTELTATKRAAIIRLNFKSDDDRYLLIEPNSDEGEGYVEIHPERNEIIAYNPVHRIYQGSGESAGFSGYLVLKFDKPFESFGTWSNQVIKPQSNQVKANGKKEQVGAYIKLSANQVLVKAAISFTSIEAARNNLNKEINDWDFDRIRQEAEVIWNKTLGQIEVKGSEQDKTLFYSALYRTKLAPRIISDVDGSYPGFAEDTNVYQAKGFEYYDDFSLWDTYRAVHPLNVLLNPKGTGDMMQSLIKKGEQGGWLPIFPCWNHYTAAMIGDHASSAIADAYIKGIRNFDITSAYRLMRKNAFEVNTDAKSYASGKGRRGLSSYLTYHYVPMEDSVWQAFHKREQVSRTLEYAYDDFTLSQVAKSLNKSNDYKALNLRALNYKNVIDPQTGYARGRYMNGSWVKDFNPFATRASFITEGSPAQYSFYVPHDIAGLMQSMGGTKRFIQKLDTLLNQGYYWHGNEPNHQIAYLYPFAGEAPKTQKQVREIIREEYDTSIGGLSGNEDSGQMSAWLVFSMMGFYPVCPGVPEYVLGSPVFDEVTIHLANGKSFVIKANNNSDKTPFIQSASMNGKPFQQTFLTHQQILTGGTLTFKMGDKANAKALTLKPFSLSK